jgi:hypothetical protein
MEESGLNKDTFLMRLPSNILLDAIRPGNYSYYAIKKYYIQLRKLKMVCKGLNKKLAEGPFEEFMKQMKKLIAENNRRDESGRLPLMNAVREENEAKVLRLLINGANPNKKEDITLDLPFDIAYWKKNQNIIDMLRQFGASRRPLTWGESALVGIVIFGAFGEVLLPLIMITIVLLDKKRGS